MKNKNVWRPSKFVFSSKSLVASRDTKEVLPSSRFIVDIIANVYFKAIQSHSKGVLLDLGCGKVPLYSAYKDYIQDNICVDWINTFHKNPYLDFEYDLNKKIPLPDNYFDTILITDVLEHIANPDLLWSEMHRMLKKDGKIILGVPFLYWIHEAPFDYFRYTEFKLRDFCQSNGLKIISLEPYGGAFDVVADIIAKSLAAAKWLLPLHNFLAKSISSATIGRKISVKTAKSFPLGYCLVAQKP